MSTDRYSEAVAHIAKGFAEFGITKDAQALRERDRTADKNAEREDQAELARLKAEEENDEGRRHLNGEDAVPANVRRDRRIGTLTKNIARRTAALPMHDQLVAEAKQKAEAAKVPFIAAAIAGGAMLQNPAVERISALLALMEEPIIDLLVADRILLGTIGDKFSVPTGSVPPFSGATLVRKLLRGIAPRLLPPSLSEARLDAAAAAASVSAIRQIKKG